MVEQAISETAKQPADAENRGLALSVSVKSPFTYLVLYQPSSLEEVCYDVAKQPVHLTVDQKVRTAIETHPNPVVGFIRMKKDDCGWIIQNSVAEKGYGPLMYDIAFSFAGKQGIVPDRESVSEAARKIWKFYFRNRKNEFRFYPLANNDPCAVWQDDDDSWFLDVRYSMRQADTGKAESMIQRSNNTINQINSSTQHVLPTYEILRRLGSAFFDSMYFHH